MVRKKNRYLLAELVYADNNKTYDLSNKEVYDQVRASFQECFGDYGIALVKQSLSVQYVNEDTKMVLIRIRRGAETMLSNALMSITKLKGHSVTFVTVHVSGSIRCAQKFWIKYKRRQLNNLIKSCATAEEKKELIAKVREVGAMDISDLFSRHSSRKREILEQLRKQKSQTQNS